MKIGIPVVSKFFSTSDYSHYIRAFYMLSIGVVVLVASLFSEELKAQEQFEPTAFKECPAKAYLTQGKQPRTYAVNLVTGDYSIVALTHGVQDPLNAVGFNTNDHYLYAWSYEHGQPARIHNDWTVEPLDGVNITDKNYYIGDVSITNNRYYVYRRGVDYGLFSIGLDPEASDYLKMIKVIDGAELSLKIYDMAFHPTDGFAYVVDRNGVLHQIDPTSGSSKELGSVGLDGIFGASYFDVEGNLYLGRNNDGSIFKISIDQADYQAVFFAKGPAAGTNDGSRCALSPISDGTDTLVDFGDAPDSYGTSLANNGARHGLIEQPVLFLGDVVDGESDSAFYPLSDNDDGDTGDEDGIQFVTTIVEGEKAIALVTSSAVGYLSAWIDFNRNGEFDTTEQVIQDQITSEGETPYYFKVPQGVSPGQSWARFRLSSIPGIPAIGGAPDGEVEDYLVNIEQQKIVVTSYPSKTDWTTIAFEDSWPFFGDYDMNDLVFYLRNTVYSSGEGATRVVLEGELAAAGASFQNGFGIRLPGVLRSEVDVDNIEFIINGVPVTTNNPLEENRREAILIVADDIFNHVRAGEECVFYRTEEGCGSEIELSFSISVPMKQAVQAPLSGILDPFVFGSEGALRGAQFASAPGRSYEIHLKNQMPTEAFNQLYFSGVGQDVSDPANGLYFQSSNGMPWAIEVGSRWNYPKEYSEINKAYQLFKSFVATNGQESAHWYGTEGANPSHIFTD